MLLLVRRALFWGLLLLVAGACALSGPSSAQAATRTVSHQPSRPAPAAATGRTTHAPAAPPSCITSWANPVSGDWFNAANWTNGVPEVTPSGQNVVDACITVAGTYTVTIAGTPGDDVATTSNLTLGGTSGTQTLIVEGLFTDNFCDQSDSDLNITGITGGTVGANGVLDLVGATSTCNGGSPNRTAHLSIGSGVLTVNGVLQTDRGTTTAGTPVFLGGNITNAGGTVNINTNTELNSGNAAPLTFDNQGTINLADGALFGDTGGNFMGDTTIINDTGGSIVNSGDSTAGFVLVSPFSSPPNVFDQGGGTTSPSTPLPAQPAVLVKGATLNYTGTGASSIALQGNSTLTGNIAAGQNLAVESEDLCNSGLESTNVTAAGSFTNAGRITLTQVSPCGGSGGTESLAMATGTLTNTGTLETDLGHASGGSPVFLGGNITNAGGTVNINTNTELNSGNAAPLTFDNQGTINLADGALFGDTGGNFMGDTTIINDTGGSIVNSGDSTAGFVLVSPFSSPPNVFDQGGGTTSPSTPNPANPAVIVDGATLNYTGTGASSIEIKGNASLSGNIAAGQNLTLATNSDCSGGGFVSAAASFTNAGDIALNHIGSCNSGPNLTLAVPGTLTNTGTVEIDHNGTDTATNSFLAGNLTNAGGTLAVNTDTAFNGEGLSGAPFTLDNKGTITLADNAILFDQNGQTVINDTGGSISNSGDSSAGFLELQSEQGNIFDQGAGTTSPSVPDPVQPAVVVAGSTLNYTGTGASTIDVQGQCCVDSSITGNIAAHQNLVIEAGCGEHSTPSTPGSLSNAGTVIFRDNPCGSGLQVALNIGGGGTLTNTGTLVSLAPSNDSATINGTLTNAGAIVVARGDQLTLNGTLNNYRSATSTLTGGKYLLSGTFQDRDSALVANGIVNDAAGIVLSGGAFIDSNGASALRNLTSIASRSLFELTANQNFSTGGSLSSSGTVLIAAGSTLTVTGNYSQTASATYGEGVTTTSKFGLMKVTGKSALAGTLAIVAPQSFSGTQGAVLKPLAASSNSGTFAKVTGAGPYKSGDSFVVGYTSTGFTLTIQG